MVALLLAGTLSTALQADPDRLRAWLADLASEDVTRREAADAALRDVRDASAEALRGLAREAGPEAVARVADILEWYTFRDGLPPRLCERRPDLARRLYKAAPKVWTLEFLKELETRRTTPPPHVLGARELTPLAGPALRGAEGIEDRVRVIDGIARLGIREAAGEVETQLSYPSWQVRRSAAGALGWLVHVPAAPTLLALLDREENEEVIGETALALASLGQRKAMPPLLSRLAAKPDGDADLRVALALGRLGGAEALPALQALVSKPSGRAGAIVALSELGEESAVQTLLPFLDEGDEDECTLAGNGILACGGKTVLEAARARLGARSDGVRAWAAQGVGLYGGPPDLAVLKPLLADKDVDVRREAAMAAGRLGDVTAVPLLRPLLADRTRAVARGAAWAMGRLGDPSRIGDWIKDPVDLVRLNEARYPEVWQRLWTAQAREAIAGTASDVASQIARAAGLSFAADPPATDAQRAWLEAYRCIPPSRGRGALALALIQLSGEYVVVLGKGSLELVRLERAREIWVAWRDGK